MPGIEWRVIEITDDPIAEIDQTHSLPCGEIGELIVRGDVVTRKYVTGQSANPLHKIHDGDSVWHRMGDVGYLDQTDRFWFCGRKSHRLRTAAGTMYTIPCESIINRHEHIYRSALVGVGPAGQQRPVVVAEPWPEHWPDSQTARQQLLDQLRDLAASHPLTEEIHDFFLHRSLPVDIRHNAKIFREQLREWAVARLEGTARLAGTISGS